MIAPLEVRAGTGPIVLSMPHGGTHIPATLQRRLNQAGHARADTDWHIDKLYDRLLPDATSVRATFHRYVIDANRGPDDASLYPGEITGLCPLTTFDGAGIYRPQCAPDKSEIQDRLKTFHAPYHLAVQKALQRAREQHGLAVLIDCHSIRSQIPFLFDGQLPDLNIGTHAGLSCAPLLQETLVDGCRNHQDYSWVLNGRFKGGWTTRHYGQPESGIHAIQIELSQRNYMHEQAPWDWDSTQAQALRKHLQTLLTSIDALARSGVLITERTKS